MTGQALASRAVYAAAQRLRRQSKGVLETMTDETRMNATAPVLESLGGGIWIAPGARVIDRTGRKMLPIGRDGFVPAAEGSVVIDKTMLMADVLDSGYTVTLFCRPRRFGKTLNMSMMKAFFEAPGV